MYESHTKDTVALTLRIPKQMLAQLNDAAWEKRMTRTAFMRESLARNLEYFRAIESRRSI